MTKLFGIFIAFVLVASIAFAHEGHDHGTGQVQATKGGVIQKAGKFYFEVVGSRSEVKIYALTESGPSSKALKAVSPKDVKITASYKLPRKSASTPITLNAQADHFQGQISAGSAHRYEVLLKVEAKEVKDEITYQIEPQE